MDDATGLHALAVSILRGPFLAAGLGEPSTGADGPLYVMWHTDGASEDRPCPDSPIWDHDVGCYDVVVRWQSAEGPGPGRLVVQTEGGTMLDEPWPGSPAELEDRLHDVAGRIAERVRTEIALFETENDGYLPGTEPSAGR